jgi:RNA polymerase sigma-70 factor (ECF subfamily)
MRLRGERSVVGRVTPVTRSSTESTFELSSLASLGSVIDAGVQAEVLARFDESRDSLLRYVCSFGIGLRDAEDVVQDTFVALYQHLRRGKSRSNLQGWLFRVAHNLALKHRTRQQSEVARADVIEAALNTQDAGQDPERALVSQERHRRVIAVLRALPERDRHCLQLRSAGLPYREIARVLGISLGAVGKSVARAVERLGCVVGR